jgi:hypothetical protein
MSTPRDHLPKIPIGLDDDCAARCEKKEGTSECLCCALRRNNKHFVRRTNVCEKQERPSTWSGGPSLLFFEIEKLVAHVRASPVSGGMDGCGYINRRRPPAL